MVAIVKGMVGLRSRSVCLEVVKILLPNAGFEPRPVQCAENSYAYYAITKPSPMFNRQLMIHVLVKG